MNIIILAAGVGSRLGSPDPKPLTRLTNGESILSRQLRLLGDTFDNASFRIVVGFKKDLIIEAFPEAMFVYNPLFADTNTSKSLLRALLAGRGEPALWLNGDVVFDSDLAVALRREVEKDRTFVSVNTGVVGDEEVKYRLDESGLIREISKTVKEPAGEALGVNYVAERDVKTLIESLEDCSDDDFFERGMEQAINKGKLKVWPFDISGFPCIEVDFIDDLDAARKTFE